VKVEVLVVEAKDRAALVARAAATVGQAARALVVVTKAAPVLVQVAALEAKAELDKAATRAVQAILSRTFPRP
jgi:hypothetical protein